MVSCSYKDIFAEDMFWSECCDVQWILIKKPGFFESDFLKNQLISTEGLVFIYYINEDGGKQYLLLGLMRKFFTKHYLKNLNLGSNASFIKKYPDILDELNLLNWYACDFKKHFVVWDMQYQQLLGTFFDSICGGIVGLLPQHWICVTNPSPKSHLPLMPKEEECFQVYRRWLKLYNHQFINYSFILYLHDNNYIPYSYKEYEIFK